MPDHNDYRKPERDQRSSEISYEELAAQAAAMRRALEDVWSKCSKEMWPNVGGALEPDAGKELLKELTEVRYQRDLLRDPVRMMVETLDSYDPSEVLQHLVVDPPQGEVDAEDSSYVPEPPEFMLTIFATHELEQAKLALQYVEATPERLSAMKTALQFIADCSDFRHQPRKIPEDEAELDTLTRQIPRWAYQALNPVSLPHADSVETDEKLAEAIRYEEALREIAASAARYDEGTPTHEISHALIVDMPDLAEKALHPPEADPTTIEFGLDDLPF